MKKQVFPILMGGVCSALLALLMSSPAIGAPDDDAGAGGPYPWAIDDDGDEQVHVDMSDSDQSLIVTVTNKGKDGSITVRFKNAQGTVLFFAVLGVDESAASTCPAGGSVTIEDPNDEDSDGASGEYSYL